MPRVVPGEHQLVAFVSSVMDRDVEDLDWARQATFAALNSKTFIRPWMFENTPASSERVDDAYLKKVREADLVIWLLGSEVTDAVQREIREARTSNRRLLVFRLPASPPTERADALLREVKPYTKYLQVSAKDDLADLIDLSLADEITRAFRSDASLGREATLDLVKRASRARCVSRFQAVGVSRDAAMALADDPAVGSPRAGSTPTTEKPFVLLIGDVGAGKSLTADKVFQRHVAAFEGDPSEPIPVFLLAETVTCLRTAVIKEAEALGDVRVSGAAVVVDAADEGRFDAVSKLVSEARELTLAFPHTTVLLTSRPLDTTRQLEERTAMSPLTEGEADALISRVAGRRVAPCRHKQFPESVLEALGRPLFSILLGLELRENTARTPKSPADLVRSMVDRCLPGARHGDNDRADLRRLACAVTDLDGGFVSVASVFGMEWPRRLLESRLLTLRENDLIGFSLKIISEWLAAEALAVGSAPFPEMLESPVRIFKWIEPLKLLISTFQFDTVSAVLAPLAETYPAVAFQVVSEGVPQVDLWPHEGPAATPLGRCGIQLRQTMEAWIRGLGPTSALAAPLLEDGRLAPLGVSIDGTTAETISAGWYMAPDPMPDVFALPAAPEMLQLGRRAGMRIRSARPVARPAWPWRWTLEDVRYRLARVMKERELPLRDGLLLQERCWRDALLLCSRGSFSSSPLPLDDLECQVLRHASTQRLWINNQRLDVAALRRMVERLKGEGLGVLESPWPAADRTSGRQVWSGFSRGRLLERTTAIFAAAFDGYASLTQAAFPTLVNDLKRFAILPARFLGRLVPAGDESTNISRGPQLFSFLDPLPARAPRRVELHIELSDRGFEANEYTDAWKHFDSYRRDQRPWLSSTVDWQNLRIFGPTPCADLVYSWLVSDLRTIALLD